ncbi:stage II sporulation protein E [Barrientosiimonas humi]|uniref:Stage II sporulation protein E n=1 Tax=Barrientosiimonas humi TaxID=999931 RepID=A0A542X9Y6_9MICO|nr:PP2C family protein-serine/threonine phosphatase [Barrientosiimonas humi]TQL32620.1 stage II sporulation protein E [Barrientosiimonas humi]CAG7572611.1 Phosphoserine phosphatase RsbU [Barrientosiimonas humi]
MSIDLTARARRTRHAVATSSLPEPFQAGLRRERWLTTLLLVLTALMTLAFVLRPVSLTLAPVVPLVVAAGLFLHAARMYVVFAAVAAGMLVTSLNAPAPPVTLAAIAVVMLLMLAVERRRMRAGIPQEVGVSILTDLRAQLERQAQVGDDLPAGWHLDSSVRAAHGEALSGDFLLTHRSEDDLLEVLLVDVAGKGLQTGTRSLMLSGAFSGLLGSTPPEGLLAAANRYLVRQSWPDGYATAVHLALDLRTGDYSLASAGHPAAMHHHAGAGRWQERSDARGVMLGVLDSGLVSYERVSGRLERGDALLLYSDGMIESPELDLGQGMDRMLGAADRVVACEPGAGEAAQICDFACAGEDDDRTTVLLRRE